MSIELQASETASLKQLVDALQTAWNAGDAAGFAAAFTDDADFVNIYGMHGRGRNAIAAGHHFIFTTVYKGSRVEYHIVSMRPLAPGVSLLHASAKLNVPAGAMAGTHEALWSGIALRTPEGWKLTAFQNTLVTAPPGLS